METHFWVGTPYSRLGLISHPQKDKHKAPHIVEQETAGDAIHFKPHIALFGLLCGRVKIAVSMQEAVEGAGLAMSLAINLFPMCYLASDGFPLCATLSQCRVSGFEGLKMKLLSRFLSPSVWCGMNKEISLHTLA